MLRIVAPLAISAVTLLASVQPGMAEQVYPWCAQYGSAVGGRNCGFESLAQCRATISGIGGYCERNTMYDLLPPQPQTRKLRDR